MPKFSVSLYYIAERNYAIEAEDEESALSIGRKRVEDDDVKTGTVFDMIGRLLNQDTSWEILGKCTERQKNTESNYSTQHSSTSPSKKKNEDAAVRKARDELDEIEKDPEALAEYMEQAVENMQRWKDADDAKEDDIW